MNKYFAYTRVSTSRQGEQGVSLEQQRDAIARYAQRNEMEVSEWFEERETAARRGRPIFSRMIRLIRNRKAAGILIHKIDRSARNLRDWSDLGELIDHGIDVRFVNEGLDLSSRGGRLSADIQAVVAADFIRNLKEETKKGFYGRLKQGILPMPAPLGYRNVGPGCPKEPDAGTAHLVKHLFELYAGGRQCFRTLLEEAKRIGLKGRFGQPLSANGLSTMLNNPFYMGLIRIMKTGESFIGVHKPLISKSTFERVHNVLTGKANTKAQRHDLLFRRRVACKHCRHSLIGETGKGNVYYRCHTRSCPTVTLREDVIETTVVRELSRLSFSADERAYLQQEIERLRHDSLKQREAAISSIQIQLAQSEDRLNRLTDAFIDRLIERDLFETRKKTLLSERLDLQSNLAQWQNGKRNIDDELAEVIGRADGACLAYINGTVEEKRDILDSVTSERVADGKVLTIMLNIPFRTVAERQDSSDGSPSSVIHRRCSRLLSYIKQDLRTACVSD